MDSSALSPGSCRKLPPLILHPFSDAHAPERLTMSARASLILNGLLPAEDMSQEELNRRLLEGRYSEVKMLFYLGKDLTRWLQQCMEVVQRDDQLRSAGIETESFAALLLEDTPRPVREKLQTWGVADYQAIFRRALALHVLFADLPEREVFSEAFLRHHHRYTDSLFECRQGTVAFAKIRSDGFQFEIYASGEYTRLLEREWGTE
jgi:hypothetical protein